MQQRSKILLNEPEKKYYSSVIYVANHVTLRQFSKIISYHTLHFWFAYVNSYWGGTIPMKRMWQCLLMNILFIEHFKIHSREKPYHCIQCVKCFQWYVILDGIWKHIIEIIYVNAVIVASFFSKNSDLIIYLEIHPKEKLCKCSHCDKVFFSE